MQILSSQRGTRSTVQLALLGAARIRAPQLRPLIRDANLYHVSDRPDGVHWDAMELWDPKRATGVLFAFRGTVLDEPRHSFRLADLRDNSQYQINFEHESSSDEVASGQQLRLQGISIHLEDPLSSELIFIRPAIRISQQ
jgi:hypothetical protein